jgi:hypothetical protein
MEEAVEIDVPPESEDETEGLEEVEEEADEAI